MLKFSVDPSLRNRLTRGDLEHPGIIQQLQAEYATIRSVMFDRYRDNVDALIDEIGRDEPQKPRRWVHDGLRRELPAESQEAFEARVKRSAFSNLLQNEERLCLDAMIAKLNELGYDVRGLNSRSHLSRGRSHWVLSVCCVSSSSAAKKV